VSRSGASEQLRYSPSRDQNIQRLRALHLNGAATHQLIETQVRSISSSRTIVHVGWRSGVTPVPQLNASGMEHLRCGHSEARSRVTTSIRMVVEFTMLNQGKVILCAVSTAAMDDLEGSVT
jgi:triosephosphate isomerase